MDRVVYYSNSGQSKAVAEYLALKLAFPLSDITLEPQKHFRRLVLVFPVYSQNIPKIVKDFLSVVSVCELSLVATYGKMSFGNVLYEISKQYTFNIVAAAYVPTKHTYLSNDVCFSDYERLFSLIDAIKSGHTIRIPKEHKNPLANICPDIRSRLGIKIIKNNKCNECNLCKDNCPFGAIEVGKVNRRCIRCLKCVYHCPMKALDIKLSLPLKLYLNKKPKKILKIYK